MAHVPIANGNAFSVVRNLLNEVGSQSDSIYNEVTKHYSLPKTVSSITTTNLFTISGGPIKVIDIAGHVTTGIAAGANNTKIVFTSTGGAAVDLCAVTNVASTAIRKCLSITGVKADALRVSPDEGVIVRPLASVAHLLLQTGVIQMNCSATTTGEITWCIIYEPITINSTVTPVT